MERVKNLLQRLQEIYYSPHQKSAIDIDLMLDYTRVMYADLLEWRKRFNEPPTRESAEKNEPLTSEAAPAAEARPAEPAAPILTGEPVNEAHIPGAPAPHEVPVQPGDAAAKAPEPATPPPPVAEPEKVPMAILQQDVSGISFEPPARPEPIKDVKEELLIEQPAVNTGIAEKQAPPAAAIPLPEVPPAAQAEASPPAPNLPGTARMPRDIRSVIGINDKYLFLNELFNNHKSNYEETLDQLNHFSNARQAEDWIRTKVAIPHKWSEEDATVQSFYAMLDKHFSER